MKKILAIKGHTTRGKEVIEILEMLGGTNRNNCLGIFKERLYIINAYGDIEDISLWHDSKYQIYTLEEFLEKYPYKIGDKVNSPCMGCIKTITSMWWDTCLNAVTYKLDNSIYTNVDQLKVFNDLQPHKEENMEEKKINQMSLANCELDEVEIVLGDKFELKIKEGKYYAVKKQAKYPKTYKECCEVLALNTMDNDAQGYKAYLIISFQELIIARNAYWKIAGEQMGLDKPWEPDWDNEDKRKHVITCQSNNIIKDICFIKNTILAFPTEEMRDSFYENFKDLIEECKEFL